VLIPDLEAGCSLAASITARTSDCWRTASRRAGGDLREYLSCGEGRVGYLLHLGQRQEDHRSARVPRVLMLPDEYLARNTAAQTKVEIIAWKGRCEVHERFTPEDIRSLRESHPGSSCWPTRSARGSRRRMRFRRLDCGNGRLCRQGAAGSCRAADRVLDERNVAIQYPDLDFVRPCQSVPAYEADHLAQDPPHLETMTHEVIVDLRLPTAPSHRPSACWRWMMTGDQKWCTRAILVMAGLRAGHPTPPAGPMRPWITGSSPVMTTTTS